MKHIKPFREFVSENKSAESIDNKFDESFDLENTMNMDFAQQQADLVGMTKEEWIAHYATPHPEEE